MTLPPPAAPSLSLTAAWSAAASSKDDPRCDSEGSSGLLTVADVVAFVKSVERLLPGWAHLFAQVPNDHTRRKEALTGAVKIKSAIKRFEMVAAVLIKADIEDSSGGNAGAAATADSSKLEETIAPVLAEQLIECQASLIDVVHGLLELSFPLDEAVTQENFSNAEAVSAVQKRTQAIVDLTETLGKLFVKAKLDPKATSQPNGKTEDPLAPDVLKMLEKTMKKQKKKDKKKQGTQTEKNPVDLAASKAAWQRTEGCYSCVLGEEVWEGVNWRRGLFLFTYIKFLLDDGTQPLDDTTEDGAPVRKSAQPGCFSRDLFASAMHSFQRMLLAQGPVSGDNDHPSLWQVESDGPLQDHTARMFHHGIYSSSHLRALKYLAELSYDQWRHGGHITSDAELAALLNRRLVHVVRHIMPGAGWTADVEYHRIVEIETVSQFSSAVFSAGLGNTPAVRSANSKATLAAEKKAKADEAGCDDTGAAKC